MEFEEDVELSDNMKDSNCPFPLKLFALLLFEPQNSNAIDWLPHGLAFRIRDVPYFTKTIMPKYFKQTKLTSFQRQLNLYGFKRLNKGDDQGAYFHPKFRKNHKELLSDIKRLPGKGNVPNIDYSGFEDFLALRLNNSQEVYTNPYDYRTKSSIPQTKNVSAVINGISSNNQIQNDVKSKYQLALRQPRLNNNNSLPSNANFAPQYRQNNVNATSTNSRSFADNTSNSAINSNVSTQNTNFAQSHFTNTYEIDSMSNHKRPYDEYSYPTDREGNLAQNYNVTSHISNAPSYYNDSYPFQQYQQLQEPENYKSDLGIPVQPKSKSKLTMNIGYERLVQGGPMSRLAMYNVENKEIDKNLCNSIPSSTIDNKIGISSGEIDVLKESTSAINPSLSTSTLDTAVSSDDASVPYEEYNRIQFNDAIFTNVNKYIYSESEQFDNYDFDTPAMNEVAEV